jgi:DNA mismatch endonuclease (patch repair protein)
MKKLADRMTKEQRSRLMSRIRSKDTKPELAMVGILDSAGIIYVRHPKMLGTPDFLIDGCIAVQVDGEFWHGRHFKRIEHKLKPFWKDKLLGNMRRDARVDRGLRRMGLSVIRIWDTDLSNPERCLARIRRVSTGRTRRADGNA